MLTMGGYGAFVWTAYFITVFVFGINLFATARERHQVKKIIRQYHES